MNLTKHTVETLGKLDEEIDLLIANANIKGFACKMCDVEMSTKQHMKNHVEGKHTVRVSHICKTCGEKT